MRSMLSFASIALTATLSAVESPALHEPRLSAQLLFGTAGFEPGIAAEWALTTGDSAISARPEVFINEDGKIGGGLMVGWRVGHRLVADRHELLVGPRVVYHNADDYGWEASASAIYSLPLFSSPTRHLVQVIGAAGIIEEKDDGQDSETRFGGSLGAGYAYQF